MSVRKWLVGLVGEVREGVAWEGNTGGLVLRLKNRLLLIAAMCGAMVAFASVAQAETITHGTTSITMDFVTIGNPNNAHDDTGHGGVGYTYRIGKYEVSEHQWDAVVDADGSDPLSYPGHWTGDHQAVGGVTWHRWPCSAIGSHRTT